MSFLPLKLKNDHDFAIKITSEIMAHEIFMDWNWQIEISECRLNELYYSIYSMYNRFINDTDRVNIIDRALQICVKSYKFDPFVPREKKYNEKQELKKIVKETNDKIKQHEKKITLDYKRFLDSR